MSANNTYTATVVPPVNYTLAPNAPVTVTAFQLVPSLITFSVLSDESNRQTPSPITLQAILTNQPQTTVPSFLGTFTWYSAASTVVGTPTDEIPGPVSIITASTVLQSPGLGSAQSSQTQVITSNVVSSSTVALVSNNTTAALVTANSSQASATTSIVSSPDSSPSGSNRNQTHKNTAEVAGVAVGCLIAGAILAGVVVFLVFRRKMSRQARQNTGSEKEPSPLNEHGEAMYVAGESSKSWKKHLPQSESDGTIRSMASRTLDQIELHVENFYVDVSNVPLTINARSELQAVDSSHLPGSLIDLLERSVKPTILIKHCIAEYIISRILFSPGNTQSFLPKDFLISQVSSSNREDRGYRDAVSQWRVLTSFLRTNGEQHLTDQKPDETTIAAARKLCRAFRPWAREDENLRLQSMIGLIKHATDLGILLFSQPSEFHWLWAEAKGTRTNAITRQDPGRFVVLPGLYKVTDEEQTPLTTPLHLLEPRLGSLSRT